MASIADVAQNTSDDSDGSDNTSDGRGSDTSKDASDVNSSSDGEDEENPEKKFILSLLPPHPDSKPAQFTSSVHGQTIFEEFIKKGSLRRESLEAMTEKYYASSSVSSAFHCYYAANFCTFLF